MSIILKRIHSAVKLHEIFHRPQSVYRREFTCTTQKFTRTKQLSRVLSSLSVFCPRQPVEYQLRMALCSESRLVNSANQPKQLEQELELDKSGLVASSVDSGIDELGSPDLAGSVESLGDNSKALPVESRESVVEKVLSDDGKKAEDRLSEPTGNKLAVTDREGEIYGRSGNDGKKVETAEVKTSNNDLDSEDDLPLSSLKKADRNGDSSSSTDQPLPPEHSDTSPSLAQETGTESKSDGIQDVEVSESARSLESMERLAETSSKSKDESIEKRLDSSSSASLSKSPGHASKHSGEVSSKHSSSSSGKHSSSSSGKHSSSSSGKHSSSSSGKHGSSSNGKHSSSSGGKHGSSSSDKHSSSSSGKHGSSSSGKHDSSKHSSSSSGKHDSSKHSSSSSAKSSSSSSGNKPSSSISSIKHSSSSSSSKPSSSKTSESNHGHHRTHDSKSSSSKTDSTSSPGKEEHKDTTMEGGNKRKHSTVESTSLFAPDASIKSPPTPMQAKRARLEELVKVRNKNEEADSDDSQNGGGDSKTNQSSKGGSFPSNVHPDLLESYRLVYKPAGLICTSKPVKEVESAEYGAYDLALNKRNIKFRTAKITPTKIGAFVTLWKRDKGKGPIMPFDVSDPIDLYVVCVREGGRFGQFVFPKNILQVEGVLSRGGKGGKRAIRVYAPWVKPDSPQAIKSQNWQVRYFVNLSDKSGKINFDQVKRFYAK